MTTACNNLLKQLVNEDLRYRLAIQPNATNTVRVHVRDLTPDTAEPIERCLGLTGCRGRSIFVPPDRCGVVARGAEPSKSNSAASYGVINGFSSVTFQLAAAAMAHVSSAPWYKNGPPFRTPGMQVEET